MAEGQAALWAAQGEEGRELSVPRGRRQHLVITVGR